MTPRLPTHRSPAPCSFEADFKDFPAASFRAFPLQTPKDAVAYPLASVILGTLVLCGLTALPEGAWEDSGAASEAQTVLPQRIRQHEVRASSLEASQWIAQSPSLRGCCGAPTEFHWVFLDGGNEATVGSPFRTRVFALDAQKKRARPSACGALRVNLKMSGRARLTRATSSPSWRSAEVELDIENEMAEVVEAEVRIESPNPTADVLLHTSRISFASGPAHAFELRIQPLNLNVSAEPEQAPEAPRGGSGPWPVHAELEVLVSIRDRFGNRVPLSTAGYGGGMMLRHGSDAKSLELTPNNGFLNFRNGDGRATIRGLRPGMVELWLETVTGGNSSAQASHDLRVRTARAVVFADRASKGSRIARENDGPTMPDLGPLAPGRSAAALSSADVRWWPRAEKVRDAFLHAWQGYRKYAWGHDELQPLSKKGRDSFGGVGMTVLDSLTTLWLMGLEAEFEEAAKFVKDELDFNRADSEISVFELTIRGVGGLLGAHALSGRQVFLERARELGERLLPAFNSSSKLPWPKWNIARGLGAASGEPTILSEAGSVQLEFRCLAHETGDRRFRDAADAAFEAIQSAGMVGLLPVYLTPPDHAPARVLASKFAFGALADSYYEYLLKQWLQSPEEERFKDLWLRVMDELPGLARPKPHTGGGSSQGLPLNTKLVEVAPGGESIWKMDHLSCFAPAMIVLGLVSLPAEDLDLNSRNNTWWPLAESLAASCVDMWTMTKTGLAPEFAMVRPQAPFDFQEVPRQARHSFLRPETAESLFYLYRYTGDERYREWGEKLFSAILAHGKVDSGFASVKDVNMVPAEKMDEMQSFVMAETFKYLYLLFSPADRLDLSVYVLNTEGHPLRKRSPH